MHNIIPPEQQKQALAAALKDEYCSVHKRRVSISIADDKLQLRYCCKEFADRISPIISEVNNQLFTRFKRGEF
jgi:hypothetical protein